MRKVILSMQTTFDGFVANEKGDMSWMQQSDEEQWNDLFQMMDNVDLAILGGGMWGEYSDYWKTALVKPDAPANEVRYATMADKTPHIVFSKTIKEPGWHNATIDSGALNDEIKKLKEQPGKNIYVVGGASFAASMIDSGMVDEYRICVNPAIINRGKSFFQLLKEPKSLELVEAKKMLSGVALLVFRQK